jgi:hypothetical protein
MSKISVTTHLDFTSYTSHYSGARVEVRGNNSAVCLSRPPCQCYVVNLTTKNLFICYGHSVPREIVNIILPAKYQVLTMSLEGRHTR